MLGSPGFYELFRHVQVTAFDISSDAFATLRDLLTRHKADVAEFLVQNYDVFFQRYLTIVTCDNYVTKRQALKVRPSFLSFFSNYPYGMLTVQPYQCLCVGCNIHAHVSVYECVCLGNLC